VRKGKYAGRLCAGAVAAATAASLFFTLPQGGPAFAAGLGSFLSGPVQAICAAASVVCAGSTGDSASAEGTKPAATALPAQSAAGGASASAKTGGESGAESSAAAAAPVFSDNIADSYALSDDSAPEGAGTVAEKTFTQAAGGIYTACGQGTIRNNTSTDNAEIAAAVSEGLPFSIEVGSSEPQVLILHTHATETYRTHAGLWFAPEDTARSTDTDVDMCAVGRVMTETLNAAGIRTLHDETLNDYPSYTGSYENSRAVAQRYLKDYPSIKVILDVHRDAMEANGTRIAPVCSIGGRQAAQVMLICGCNNGTTVPIPDCHQNLRFAAAWEQQMEKNYPGFTRPVLYSYRYYNQDLSTGALLIEVGGHGNSLDEALYAGHLAAQALAALFGA
jgi:stage II sporulation protein P